MKSISPFSTTTLAALVASLGLVACGGAELEPTDQARSASATRPSVEAMPPPAPAPQPSEQRAEGRGRRGPPSPEKLMERFDANKNGTLEATELPERMQKHLVDIDTSKDKVVTKDELAAHFKNKGRERGKRHFERKDANKDGLLDAGEVGSKRWSKLSVADANGDQKLTPEELVAAFEAGKIERGKQHGQRKGPEQAAPTK